MYNIEVNEMDYYSFFKKLKAEDPRIEYATAHKAPECKGLSLDLTMALSG